MKRPLVTVSIIFAAALAFIASPRADGPHIYAIKGATLVTATAP